MIHRFGLCWLCDSDQPLHCGCCPSCFNDLPRLAPVNIRPSYADDYCATWLAALRYCAPVRGWIYQCKYYGVPRLARYFAWLMIAQVTAYHRQHKLLLPDVLMPVPMSVRRYGQRGFNQAQMIARYMSDYLGIPCIDGLNRSGGEHPQHTLSRSQRAENMVGAITTSSQVKVWQDKHVVVIDDVITTGATINAAALALLNDGAGWVSGWALAHPVTEVRT